MKKSLFLIIAFSLATFLFAGQPKTKTVRKFTWNGETIKRKVEKTEWWQKYDSKNRCIYQKDSDGGEEFYDYDDADNLVHAKQSGGYEQWFEFDERGNEVYWHDSSRGNEIKSEYNSKNQLTKQTVCRSGFSSSYTYERVFEYDERGNLCYWKQINLDQSDNPYQQKESWSEYDSQNRKIYEKRLDGPEKLTESWISYGEKSKSYKDSDGDFFYIEYDENHNEIFYKSNLIETKSEYDELGNLIHRVFSPGEEKWWVYEYDENGNVIYLIMYNTVE